MPKKRVRVATSRPDSCRNSTAKACSSLMPSLSWMHLLEGSDLDAAFVLVDRAASRELHRRREQARRDDEDPGTRVRSPDVRAVPSRPSPTHARPSRRSRAEADPLLRGPPSRASHPLGPLRQVCLAVRPLQGRRGAAIPPPRNKNMNLRMTFVSLDTGGHARTSPMNGASGRRPRGSLPTLPGARKSSRLEVPREQVGSPSANMAGEGRRLLHCRWKSRPTAPVPGARGVSRSIRRECVREPRRPRPARSSRQQTALRR